MNNITQKYATYANQQADRPALIVDEKVVTYLEWSQTVAQVAKVFAQETSTNRRVALFLPNGALFLQIFAGAAAAGWATVIGDMRWTQKEIDERLALVSPDIVIADEKMQGKINFPCEKVIYSNEIVAWTEKAATNITRIKDENPPFYIGFTSGSTGKPKAFVRSHQSWLESFKCNQIDLNMTMKEHVLIPASFTSSTFLYAALSTLYLGGTIYILRKYTAKQVMETIDNFPITTIYIVPTMIQSLIAERRKSERSLTFISTGAKLLPTVRKNFKNNFPNVKIHEFYGASELSYVSVLKDEEQKKYGESVGKPVHNAQVAIIGDDGKEVPVNELGILYVKSKMFFDGYITAKNKLIEIEQDGWATVQDIARIDAEGYIYILGRENAMILYGGMNVFPLEVERVIKNMPQVKEVAVFGMKDEYWGEKVVACVKGDVTIADLKEHCRQHLASYKIPRIWVHVDSFPYTLTGKISIQELRKQVQRERI